MIDLFKIIGFSVIILAFCVWIISGYMRGKMRSYEEEIRKAFDIENDDENSGI